MGERKALSLSERAGLVRGAIYAHVHQLSQMGVMVDCYVEEVYDDYAIVRDYASEGYYRVSYSIGEQQAVTITPREQWQRVEKEWVDLKRVVTATGGLKALGSGKVGGFLVVFGDESAPDLTGDFFTKSTDFDFEDGDPVTVYYNHGLDPVLKRRKLGKGTLHKQDAGVWMEAQLELRDDYERAVYNMVEAGKMGLSSGTLPNLVEREPVGKAMHIKSWPLGKDASITPTPAEPRTNVQPFKSFISSSPAGTPEAQPEASGDAASAAASKAADIQIVSEENKHMGENPTNPTPPAGDSVSREEFKALSDRMNKIMDWMENSPAVKSAGFFTADGGKADPEVKNFGDFLKAVQRGDHKRLTEVYATKALSEDSGTSGGYLIAPEFMPRLLEMTGPASVVRSRATVIPVKSSSGSIPALNQYTAPDAGEGDTAYAGGVTLGWTAEGGTTPETDPDFDKIEWRVNKLAGRTKVSNELLSDSALIEAILMRLFARAIAAKEDYSFLRGDGVGKPLGILRAPAAVGITPDTNATFAYADAVEMVSRFQPQDASKAAWVMHRTLLPDLAAFEVGTGGSVFVNNIAAGMPTSLLGYPVLLSEHLPAADNSGCVLLADFSAYVIFDRQQMAVAFSEHAAFETDEGMWRVTERLDGQPWVRGTVTEADPQGATTVSPYIFFND